MILYCFIATFLVILYIQYFVLIEPSAEPHIIALPKNVRKPSQQILLDMRYNNSSSIDTLDKNKNLGGSDRDTGQDDKDMYNNSVGTINDKTLIDITDGNYNNLSASPRKGSNIDGIGNQLNLLRCSNQPECIVTALQLIPQLNIYFCSHPANHGVRFYHLIREGLLLHPNVKLLSFEDIDDADYVIYLPGSSPWHKTECTSSGLARKLLVMDEFDGHSLFYPYTSSKEVKEVYGEAMVWYFMYFKRSFVIRKDGKYLSHPHLEKTDIYPMTYAIGESYARYNFNFIREIEILCTLRGSKKMSTRLRVQRWVNEYVSSRNVEKAITRQVNKATRTTVNKAYFQLLYNSQIIITVNPANWEGDFRLWESFASGALVFVDPMFVPHHFPLQHGIHAIFYSNDNQTDLFVKLDYYRKHTFEARKIAINGYLYTMKYHRTVNLIDYVLRSAHMKDELMNKQNHHDKLLTHSDLLTAMNYTYTAQYLNSQTRNQLDKREMAKKKM
jgi:hypothetical protein